MSCDEVHGAKRSEVIFAIGHSTRPVDTFVRILQAHSVNLLVDIRTIPRSRHNPQFNKDSLCKELQANGIGYMQLKGLGGLRHPQRDSLNTGWRNADFRGYADYMQRSEFSNALEKLIRIGRLKKVAIMCAEGNPFRCHRLLVADALTVRGVNVYHIQSSKSIREHELTRFATANGEKVTYPSN